MSLCRYTQCRYGQCHYADCEKSAVISAVIIQIVIMLGVIRLNVFMPSLSCSKSFCTVIMLSVFRLRDFILNVTAPPKFHICITLPNVTKLFCLIQLSTNKLERLLTRILICPSPYTQAYYPKLKTTNENVL